MMELKTIKWNKIYKTLSNYLVGVLRKLVRDHECRDIEPPSSSLKLSP